MSDSSRWQLEGCLQFLNKTQLQQLVLYTCGSEASTTGTAADAAAWQGGGRSQLPAGWLICEAYGDGAAPSGGGRCRVAHQGDLLLLACVKTGALTGVRMLRGARIVHQSCIVEVDALGAPPLSMHLNNEMQAERWAHDLRNASSWSRRVEETIQLDSELSKSVHEVAARGSSVCGDFIEAVAEGFKDSDTDKKSEPVPSGEEAGICRALASPDLVDQVPSDAEDLIPFCAEPIKATEPIAIDEEASTCRALTFSDSADDEAEEPTVAEHWADELLDASCVSRSRQSSGDQVRRVNTNWLWSDNGTAWSRSPEEAVLPGFGPAVPSKDCKIFSMSADDSVENLQVIDPCIEVEARKGITDCTDSSNLEDWVDGQMQRSSDLLALFKQEMHFMEKVADELADRRNLAECEATCIDALEEEEAEQQKGLCMLESMVSSLSARCRDVKNGGGPQYFDLWEEDNGVGTSSSSGSLYSPTVKGTKSRCLTGLRRQNALRTSKVKENIRRIVQGAEDTWEAQRRAFQQQAVASAKHNHKEACDPEKKNGSKLPKGHARQPLRLQRRDAPREQQSLLRNQRILAQQHIDRELQRAHWQQQLEEPESYHEDHKMPEDPGEQADADHTLTKVDELQEDIGEQSDGNQSMTKVEELPEDLGEQDDRSMTKLEECNQSQSQEPSETESGPKEVVGRFGRKYIVDVQSPCQSPRQSATQASDDLALPDVTKAASMPEASAFVHDAEPAPEPNCMWSPRASPRAFSSEQEEPREEPQTISPPESPRLVEREKRSLARRMMNFLAAEHGQQQKLGEGHAKSRAWF